MGTQIRNATPQDDDVLVSESSEDSGSESGSFAESGWKDDASSDF